MGSADWWRHLDRREGGSWVVRSTRLWTARLGALTWFVPSVDGGPAYRNSQGYAPMSGGGSVRRSEINTFGGRSPVLSLESSAQAICRSRLRPAIGLTAIWGRGPLYIDQPGQAQSCSWLNPPNSLSLSALPNVRQCFRQHLTRQRLRSRRRPQASLAPPPAPLGRRRPAPGR